MTWVQPRSITSVEAQAIGEVMRLTPDEIEAMVLAVKWSVPALVLTYEDRPYITLGFIPLDLYAVSAYAWMQWTSEIFERPYATTRKAVEVFAEMKQRYSRITGHCSFGPKPERVLTRLGAKFSTDSDGRRFYVMESPYVTA